MKSSVEHIALDKDAYDPATVTGPFATRLYDVTTISPANIHDSKDIDANKISYCALELDFSVEAILNRHLLTPRHQHQDFVEFLQPETIVKDKLVHSVKELWDDERQRRSAKGESGPNDVLDPEMALPRLFDDTGLEWNIERELREKVENLAKADLKAFRSKVGTSKRDPAFDTFVEDHAKAGAVESSWQKKVRTTFEQVDAVYPSRMKLDAEERYVFGSWAIRGIGLGEDVAYHRSGSSSPEKSLRARGKERMSAELVINEDLWTVAAQNMVIKEEDEDETMYSSRAAALQAQEATSKEGLEDSEDEGEPLVDEIEVDVLLEEEEEEGVPVEEEVAFDDSEPPPPKKARLGVETIEAPSPPIRNAQHNPFASPEKPTRVRMANLEPEVEAQRSSSPADVDIEMLPPAQQPYSSSHLDGLPDDAFAEYNPTPTPTIRDAAPTQIPFDIRSHTALAEYDSDLLPPPDSTASTTPHASDSQTSSVRHTQDSETLAQLDSTADSGKKRVTFAVPDSPSPGHASTINSATASIAPSQTSSGTTSTTRGEPVGLAGSSSLECESTFSTTSFES